MWGSVGGGLSDPLGSYVIGMCVFGDSLVVAGEFEQAGAVPANNVAFWDGAAWHAAGAGLNAPLDAVTVWNGQLVAGGSFTSSGGRPMQGAAVWDGSAWQPLGTNAVEVEKFCVADGALFAAGEFRLPDQTIIRTVARWTGSDWGILGSGTNNYAIAVHGGYLYNAGYGVINGHVSHNLSRIPLTATLDAPRPQPRVAVLSLAVSPNPARASIALSFTLPVAGHVRLTLHDVSGREVARPADGEFAAGPQRLVTSAAMRPGIYFARLQTPIGVRTTRFVVLGR